MINSHRRISFLRFALFACDAAAFCLAAWISGVRQQGSWTFADQYAIVFLTLLAALYAFRTYEVERYRPQATAVATVAALFVGGAVATSLLMLFPPMRISKPAFITLFGTAAIATTMLHTLFATYGHLAVPAERIVVIGNRAQWDPLFQELSCAVFRRLLPVAYLETTDEKELLSLASLHPHAKTIVIADPTIAERSHVSEFLENAPKKGYSVRYLPLLAEQTIIRIPLSVAEAFREYYAVLLNSIAPNALKRVFDILIALAGLLVAAPLMAVIGILVSFTSGMPILYRQKRVGLSERPFTIHKFRTMKNPLDADAAQFADEADDRITPLGRILRKTRLDELPQLWDVLVGNMSIIGPRPEQQEFHEQFSRDIPFYRERTRVRPGITGWAQINFAYASDRAQTARKLEYDLFYIVNQSLLLDLQILLKTVETILGMRGSK